MAMTAHSALPAMSSARPNDSLANGAASATGSEWAVSTPRSRNVWATVNAADEHADSDTSFKR